MHNKVRLAVRDAMYRCRWGCVVTPEVDKKRRNPDQKQELRVFSKLSNQNVNMNGRAALITVHNSCSLALYVSVTHS